MLVIVKDKEKESINGCPFVAFVSILASHQCHKTDPTPGKYVRQFVVTKSNRFLQPLFGSFKSSHELTYLLFMYQNQIQKYKLCFAKFEDIAFFINLSTTAAFIQTNFSDLIFKYLHNCSLWQT